MSPLRLLQMLFPPRYVVRSIDITENDRQRLACMGPHDVVALEGPGKIEQLPMPPIHIHMGNRPRSRFASMGPTLRRR